MVQSKHLGKNDSFLQALGGLEFSCLAIKFCLASQDKTLFVTYKEDEVKGKSKIGSFRCLKIFLTDK